MGHDIRSPAQNQLQIAAIEETNDTLTSRHLPHFDAMKNDAGYAATLERRPADPAPAERTEKLSDGTSPQSFRR